MRMPEIPDIVVYTEHLSRLLRGRRLETVRVASPFVPRTVEPPLSAFEGVAVRGCERLGKRIVLVGGRAMRGGAYLSDGGCSRMPRRLHDR